MGQGIGLTVEEKITINKGCANEISIAKIAKSLKRSKTVIKNYLRLKDQYGTKYGKASGRVFKGKQSSLSKIMINLICNDQVVKRKTLQEIKDSHPTLS